MNPSLAICTQGLVKNYGAVQALRGINLEVKFGEIFGFLGPNGAGKTTTIRCLLDLIRPNGGVVEVLGKNPRQDGLNIRARCGYLPGELHFDENLSVEAALRYLNALRKSKADWEYTRSLARKLDLDLKPAIKNLSKGNKQKVGVVQALMHRPELLLLDEPTSSLDPLLQQEVLTLVKEARQHGATVFFSSHNLSEVQEITDRVGIIRQGMLVEVAETQALVIRAMRRVKLRFEEAITLEPLLNIQGVKVLSEGDGISPILQVEGEVGALVKALADLPLVDFETEQPSLEEVFLAFYEQDN
jgi:ABC-2 type transport system ATP-binding protein